MVFKANVPKKTASKPVTDEVQAITLDQETVNKPATIGADVTTQNPTVVGKCRDYPTPAEDVLNREILNLSQDVVHLIGKRDAGLATEEQLKDLETKRKTLKEKEMALKFLRNNRERQRRKRESEKKVLQENPDLAKKFKRRNAIGRPRIEQDQPDLLKAIVDIATHGAAADDRRRSETLRSIKTLDELTTELQSQGFKVHET